MINRGEDRILAKGSTLKGAELSDILQRECVLQAEYEQWRLALGEDGRASLATVKRIRTLERELARKEKALAEVVEGIGDGSAPE